MNYIKIIDQKTRCTYRLQLPVTVGSGSGADIIINSQRLAPVAKAIVLARHGKSATGTSAKPAIKLLDVTSGDASPMAFLEQLGLKVKGPFFGTKPASASLKTKIVERFQDEARWFAGMPSVIQTVFLGGLPQGWRLASWMLISLNTLSFAMIHGGSREVAQDRSLERNEMAYESMLSRGFGAMGTSRPFANGVRFSVQVPVESNHIPHVLSFESKELDQAGELRLSVNGTTVWESTVQRECISSYCTQIVAVPGNVVRSGNNEINFEHMSPTSDYVLRSILFQRQKVTNEQERGVLEQSLAAATRSYNERGITYKNLILAHDQVRGLNRQLTGRQGVVDLAEKASALTKTIDAAAKQLCSELEFTATREAQLGHVADAKEKFKQLMEISESFRFDARGLENVRAIFAQIENGNQ